jgi:DNA-directed RNA polymerase alpha subunit
MIDPCPELPDDTPVESVGLPLKMRDALTAAGIRTVGEIREKPDGELLQIQNLGKASLTLLRESLGLPSSLGVRNDPLNPS